MRQQRLVATRKTPMLGVGVSPLPERWQWVALGDLAKLNPSKREIASLSDELMVSFVPMAGVDDVTGTITSREVRRLGEVRKGYTYFREGDLLFARITPCMENGKCAIANGLTNGIGFGSTEFHVIRPGRYISAAWIRFYLRQKWLRDRATDFFTGSVGQQRVPEEFLRRLAIPIPFRNGKPDIDEQKRVVARIEEIFSKLDQIREVVKQGKQEAEELLPAALEKVLIEAKQGGCSWVKLSELASVDRRQVKPREKPESTFWVLTMDTVESHTGRLINRIESTGGEIKGAVLGFGPQHVLYGKLRPYLNKVFVPCAKGVCSPEFVPLVPDDKKADRDYLAWLLRSPRVVKYAMSYLTGARQPRVDMNALLRLTLPVPFRDGRADLERQERIAAYLDNVAAQRQKLLTLYEQRERELEELRQSVLHRAFRGEL